MAARIPTIARTATVLSRNPLGLLALCLVIGEAIAGMFLLRPGALLGVERVLLCSFVVAYPLCVVAAIYRLVSRHHTKLYAPADGRRAQPPTPRYQRTPSPPCQYSRVACWCGHTVITPDAKLQLSLRPTS